MFVCVRASHHHHRAEVREEINYKDTSYYTVEANIIYINKYSAVSLLGFYY